MTDYEDNEIGDAILMLQRIAKFAGKQIEFRIVPLKAVPLGLFSPPATS